jgi:hypothetical protein
MVQLWQQRGHQWWFWERRVKSPRLEPRYTNSLPAERSFSTPMALADIVTNFGKEEH